MLPEPALIVEEVRRSLEEDVGTGDVTAALLPPAVSVTGRVICREEAILAGSAWFDEVFRQIDSTVKVEWLLHDGGFLTENRVVCTLSGNAAAILTGERVALNFLQTLSGTATAAASYVQAVAGTGARILDTRKTLPGLRRAQKYAVTCGGAHNHRMGLYDAILIKENHIAAAGSIQAVLQQAKSLESGLEIEIEVEDLGELEEALQAGAGRILLDNFSLAELRQAVELNRGRARLEASGGVDLSSVRAIAQSGVDDISVGALTKDLRAVDFSLQLPSL